MTRILLVDDVFTARSLTERVLRHVGHYEVQTVGSGPEAIDAALADPPDVIVLDISMAHMDGITTLHELRAKAITCPVIAYTARAEQKQGEFVAQGFNAYVPKTGNLGDLLDALWNVLAKERSV
jgi:two-component system OmpR family response regulator